MEGALRAFRVSVDVRSFKAGVKMPMRAANVFVKVVFPQQIIKLALESPHPGNAAKLTAPLRSHPPILVERCTEVAIPNGYVALELPVSVLGLAATLAQDPQLVAEVYHRDKYAADSLIGVAHIPMSRLMHEPRLDGHAPVKADQVCTGFLRVVLSAEELGPVAGQNKRGDHAAAPPTFQPVGLEESFLLLKNNISQFLGSKAVAVQTEQQSAAAAERAPPKNKVVEKNQSSGSDEKASISFQTEAVQCAIPNANELREHAEYELAWEFEMWRRAEEAKWRAELKEREVTALRSLEEDAKKRAQERTSAIERVRHDLADLEGKVRSKLLAVEKRERSLLLAEEEACLKREVLERECAQRIADAECAARRIQSDCDHKLELEQSKYAMLQEQYDVLEGRMANTNGVLASLEKDFAAYKAAQRSSSEAELSAQVLLLKHKNADLERKLETTTKARNNYKSQVLRLAKELANVRQSPKPSSGHDDRTAALASLIEVHAQKANEERFELRHLKEQVERLQIQEQAALAASRPIQEQPQQPVPVQTPVQAQLPTLVPGPAAIVTQIRQEQAPEQPQIRENRTVTVHPEQALVAGNLDVQRKNLSLYQEPSPTPKKDLTREQGPKDLDDGTKLKDCKPADDLAHSRNSSLDSSEDMEPFFSQISAFQKSEILRLKKQKADLLDTGVYTNNDRIIKGLDQEIKRLQSVDVHNLR